MVKRRLVVRAIVGLLGLIALSHVAQSKPKNSSLKWDESRPTLIQSGRYEHGGLAAREAWLDTNVDGKVRCDIGSCTIVTDRKNEQRHDVTALHARQESDGAETLPHGWNADAHGQRAALARGMGEHYRGSLCDVEHGDPGMVGDEPAAARVLLYGDANLSLVDEDPLWWSDSETEPAWGNHPRAETKPSAPHRGTAREREPVVWGVGVGALSGLMRLELPALNRELRRRGFSSVGHNAFVAGVELVSHLRRFVLGGSFSMSNPTNAFRPHTESGGGATGGGQLVAWLGYEAISGRWWRLTPEFGFGLSAFFMGVDPNDPALDLGSSEVADDPGDEIGRWANIWHIGIRSTTLIPIADYPTSTTSVTLGGILGYREQFNAHGWTVTREGRGLRNVEGPYVDLSGPIFLVSVGIITDEW